MAVEEAIQPLEDEFRIKREEKEKLWNTYRFFSPAIFMQQLLSDIAGTGEKRYRDFHGQMQEAHKEYRGFFARKIFRQEKMTALDYDQVPNPSYQPGKNDAFRAINFTNLLWLLSITVTLALVGILKLKRTPHSDFLGSAA